MFMKNSLPCYKEDCDRKTQFVCKCGRRICSFHQKFSFDLEINVCIDCFGNHLKKRVWKE